MGKRKDESIYAHKVPADEVRAAIDPLRDKEPTPAWYEQFIKILDNYDVNQRIIKELMVESKKCNLLGRRYKFRSFSSTLTEYNSKRHGWTNNNAKTVNDHLDILAEYLMKPVEEPVLTLKERLEQELKEGKWPTVEEKRKATEKMVELLKRDTPPTAVYTKHEKLTANDIHKEAGLKPIEDPKPETLTDDGMIKAAKTLAKHFHETAQKLKEPIDIHNHDNWRQRSDKFGVVGTVVRRVRPRKIHKHHKSHTITININLGR